MGTARAGRRRPGRSRGRGRPEARGWRPGSPRCGRTRPGRARRARASGRRGHGWGGRCRCLIVEPVNAHEPPRAVVFDFNGTISDDEPLLAELCTLIFGEIGIEVTEERYFSEFAGYSDPEIVERVLADAGRPDPAVAQSLLDRRTELYLARAGTGETVHPPVAAVRARDGRARAGRGRLRRRPRRGRGRAGGQRPAPAPGGRGHGRRRRPREARSGGLSASRSIPARRPRCRRAVVRGHPFGVMAAVARPGCGASAWAHGVGRPASRAGAEAVVAGLDWSIPLCEGCSHEGRRPGGGDRRRSRRVLDPLPPRQDRLEGRRARRAVRPHARLDLALRRPRRPAALHRQPDQDDAVLGRPLRRPGPRDRQGSRLARARRAAARVVAGALRGDPAPGRVGEELRPADRDRLARRGEGDVPADVDRRRRRGGVPAAGRLPRSQPAHLRAGRRRPAARRRDRAADASARRDRRGRPGAGAS